MDISNLSDTELKDMLVERGIDVGPISGTTRRVYERKLQRLIDTEHGLEGSNIEDPSEYDFANADTLPMENVTLPGQQEIGRLSPKARESPNLQAFQHDQDILGSSRFADDILTRRTIRPEYSSTKTTSSAHQLQSGSHHKQVSQKSNSGGMSLFKKLLLLVVAVVIILLIIYNMEPAASDPVKRIQEV